MSAQSRRAPRSKPVLGLRANWRQFTLLVAVNAFVGGMVGLERAVLPSLAVQIFDVRSTTVTVSFIATFALAKAITNLFAGRLSNRVGRHALLIAGWLIGLPVPFLIILAPSWSWVIAANVLLGVNQGLAWSMTVNMKIDLVGPTRRGLALGFNEAAGYLAVAGAAFLSGVIAERAGLRPAPFYLGIAFAASGLALSVLFVRDTTPFMRVEAEAQSLVSPAGSLWSVFAETTWRRRNLFGICQTGFFNNLNDGLAWGILPLLFASHGLSITRIALLAATYPLLWGGLQLGTGWASDAIGRKPLIVGGMVLQGLAIALIGAHASFGGWLIGVILLGIGTALVYPTLLAAIGDAVHPSTRATSLGVYRFWRDAGAMAGALLAGALADAFGLVPAIQTVALLTVASGLVATATLEGSAGQVVSSPEEVSA